MLANHLGVQATISNQKQGFLMIQTVFLTLMVSSNFSTKVGHLELLMVWNNGCILKLKIWFTLQKLVSNSCQTMKMIATVPTQVLLIKSVINSLSSILGTFVMKTGFVTHVKSALGWIKTAKSKNSTRFLSNNLLTLLGTSVTLKSSITRDNSTLS